MMTLKQMWLLRLARIVPPLAIVLLIGCAAASSPPASEAAIAAQVSEGPPIPVATAGHIGGIVSGVPVVAGGSSWSEDRKTKRWNRECFVFRDGKWSPGPSLPQSLSDAAYASGPDGLYAAGGTDGKAASNLVLHLASTSADAAWQPLAPLPEPVEAASGAILSNTFYVVGGFSDGKASNRLWALDLDKPGATWRNLAPLPADGRGYVAFVASGSQLYLFGGFVLPPYQPKAAIFADAYRYEPASNAWARLEGLDLPGYAWTATAIGKDQIMLTGRVPELEHISDEIWLVNLQSLHVRSIGRMVIGACCIPSIPVASRTWWLPGGEPDTHRSRTARNSVVKLQGSADQ